MKNLSILLVVLFAAVISLNTGCKGEDPTGPTLTVSADVTTVNPGDSIVFTYSVSSNEDLDKLTWTSTDDILIDGVQEGSGEFALEGTSDTDNEFVVFIKSTQTLGDITFTFTATDKDGEEYAAEKEIVITVEEAAVTTGDPIDTYTAILMGAQSNATEGSFLATTTGTVYTQANANTNSSLIDIIYYYGSSNLATLCGPTEPTVNGGSGNLTLATGLTTQNATVLSTTTISASEFDAFDDDLEIAQLSVGTATLVTSLAVDDVVSFKTAAGKIGVAKVTALTADATGSITLNVKVQQ
ncbi:MAG TPA: hypothetical protein DDX39_01770 [Bacteroidales bacterium]|nr:MAG: hypothetical protein A2W98_07985 [Bacteroidetes bacterium GWF2_33_38]OFY88364.1 MAG: hypothetical protein A2236_02245 [Bacteroidetes bacterium RIFOXYA2_FULL_33_7]HBF87340.1 hypothetical protein [Bacteroidales bacterium]